MVISEGEQFPLKQIYLHSAITSPQMHGVITTKSNFSPNGRAVSSCGGGPGAGLWPGGGRPARGARGVWDRRLLRAVVVSDWLSDRSADAVARGLKPAGRSGRPVGGVKLLLLVLVWFKRNILLGPRDNWCCANDLPTLPYAWKYASYYWFGLHIPHLQIFVFARYVFSIGLSFSLVTVFQEKNEDNCRGLK